MPASQLKRLKQSLRESGVTGPQKSKKQKKSAAQGKGDRRNDRAAQLQHIRDTFNPFEVKATSARPTKFESASANNVAGKGGYKAVLHRPGVSKSAGEEMRRATLLPEMRRRNKVGGLVDRRIGEGDVDMTPEEKAVQRFAREKERKAKGRGLFDLEGTDDEPGGFQLTHGGKGVGELAADDFGESVSGGSEDESEDGGLLRKKRRRSDVEEEDNEADDGQDAVEAQPERKKTKKEVMEEIIAKSKMHKYERQKAKEDDDDLREELDKGFGEILGLLQGVKKPPPPPKQTEEESTPVASNGPTMNPDRQKLLDGNDRDKVDKAYEKRLKELARDARAKPSDKTLSAEEKALKEAQRLKELEEKRLKRMRGEDISEDEGVDKNGDTQMEGDQDFHDDEILDEAADFGFTSSTAQPKQIRERDVQPDEDEFALDEDMIANDSEVELSDEDSDAESDMDSEAEVEAQLEEEDDEFVRGMADGDTPALTGANAVTERKGKDASGLSYTYPCPRSHAELLDIVTDLKPEQLPTVIQRIRALYHPSLSASNKDMMADFSSALVEHLAWMGNNAQPLAVTEQVIRHLHSLSRTYPSQIAEAFRAQLLVFHEKGQASSGDLIVLTAIGSIYPTSDHFHQVVTPAITLMARWLGLYAPTNSKPGDLHTLSTGAFLVALCLKYQTLSKRYIPEALRFTLRAISTKSAKLEAITPHVTNLTTMADLWKDTTAFIEIFTPALLIIKAAGQKKAHQHISILLRQSRLNRRPLTLHTHRKLPIRTSIPKFEENFNPDKHYDPDKERADAAKLQKEYKSERKGALRELRKDANFIAREQLREKRERDEEYERKYRKLVAEVQSEEGAAQKEYGREVAKRERAKKSKKK